MAHNFTSHKLVAYTLKIKQLCIIYVNLQKQTPAQSCLMYYSLIVTVINGNQHHFTAGQLSSSSSGNYVKIDASKRAMQHLVQLMARLNRDCDTILSYQFYGHIMMKFYVIPPVCYYIENLNF